jgi:predicted nuclease of predicted toxin-antitoxin system
MGTLSSELAPHVPRWSGRPRVYVDANIPAGLVTFMRTRLDWDVLFVVEAEDLRRAPDRRHFELAHQLRRTLVTLDRDYLDDVAFPPERSGGVLVLSAPNERELSLLLARVDRAIFQRDGDETVPLPLAGRKLHVQTDWGREPAGRPVHP